MTATATTVRFSKTEAGRYYAKGAAHTYLVVRVGKGWELVIYTKKTVAGCEVSDREVHAYYCETKRLAALVAEEFETLGEDYRPSEHGHRERTTEARLRAHTKERA